MTKTQTTCTAHNGTYVCARTDGHSGRHETSRPIRDNQNTVVAIRAYRWSDSYGQVLSATTAPANSQG